MANVIVTQDAVSDIDEILENIEDFTGWRSSADRLLAEFEYQFGLLQLFPEMGSIREDGLRQLIINHYRVIYEFDGETVLILTVIHSRRLYPKR